MIMTASACMHTCTYTCVEAHGAPCLPAYSGKATRVSAALGELGVVTEKNDAELRTEMAYGMFDTRGKVDPFDPNSPIKRSAVTTFPADLFFVLRVVQLLRGLANGEARPGMKA